MRSVASRYTAVAIALHWAIAAAIIGNTLLGWWMHRAIQAQGSQGRAIAAFQLHKSIGLTVLALSLVRLMWRWLHRPPPLPAHTPAWARLVAKAVCWTFYALMIAIPVSGWLYVSTQWRADAPLNVPTLWFGLIEIPHLFGLNDSTPELREWLAGTTLAAHELLVWSTLALLVLHVAAALKHQFIDGDEVLRRMLPVRRPDAVSPGQSTGLPRTIMISGFAAIVIATLLSVALMRAPSDGTVAPAQEAQADISSAPGGWVVDSQHSEIAFSGTHAGVAFRGRFTRWSADLRINPADVTLSHIAASIETGSATDGVPLHDASLPQAEWFDIAKYPLATFRATRIRPAEDSHGYVIDGVLKIKKRDIAVSPLTLQIEGDQAIITGRTEIDRSAIDLGMQSDPDAAWVSRTIVVDVRLTAGQGS